MQSEPKGAKQGLNHFTCAVAVNETFAGTSMNDLFIVTGTSGHVVELLGVT